MCKSDRKLIPPTFDDVLTAYARVCPYIHRTPVFSSRFVSSVAGAKLIFKCENLQITGAFKARGALNAVLGLENSAAKKGVATHSSGNHALALAYAASLRKAPCHVVMPRNALLSKKHAALDYGGKIVECESSASARERMLVKVLAEYGAEFIHPFNDARVIAGQGTCGLEFCSQAADLDAVVAPIGGGGLVSGVCIAFSELAPATKIYAAEPKNADDAFRSIRAGRIISDDSPQTIADGLRVPITELTWKFVHSKLTDVLTVSEQSIVDAMKIVWQRMKIVIEPSSAVALAAVLANSKLFARKRVGIILTGGNVDLERLPWQRHFPASPRDLQ
ncbi:MAG: pyridoxal-phosphate dependent enzyme [Albidovulum sp.]|nr:pyridoxal-phosphate dependent enzyme [Albidovulum sp.]MDE0532241.1 pyridoxal-phosphate dependent enzyme [Albidovulum sp.]